MNIPQPEVTHIDGEFGRLCWAMACAAMDETAGDFDVPIARAELPLIPFFDNPAGDGVGQRRILVVGRIS